jgi:hypothetical protein
VVTVYIGMKAKLYAFYRSEPDGNMAYKWCGGIWHGPQVQRISRFQKICMMRSSSKGHTLSTSSQISSQKNSSRNNRTWTIWEFSQYRHFTEYFFVSLPASIALGETNFNVPKQVYNCYLIIMGQDSLNGSSRSILTVSLHES